MGRIWTKRSAVIATLGETVGYKSGLALTSEEMREWLPEHSDVWEGSFEEMIGIRAEVFAEMVAFLLHRLGNIPSPEVMHSGIVLSRKYQDNNDDLKLLGEIIQFLNSTLPSSKQAYEKTGDLLSLDLVMDETLRKFGPGKPVQMVLEFFKAIQAAQHVAPWSDVRRVNWKNTAELKDLFGSESLETMYGTFFDQRYIDYLDRNFNSIDQINWRKFEGLTAEFFEREGFNVEVGPGRNDEGIDVRVWHPEDDKKTAPAILVQCKRQRSKVEKVVVKALWADIQAEKAATGLIVTTNSLSPGARKISTARAYPIQEADRATVNGWIKEMRTPGTGVFLGE